MYKKINNFRVIEKNIKIFYFKNPLDTIIQIQYFIMGFNTCENYYI